MFFFGNNCCWSSITKPLPRCFWHHAGAMKPMVNCPAGYLVTGISMRIQPGQGAGTDDYGGTVGIGEKCPNIFHQTSALPLPILILCMCLLPRVFHQFLLVGTKTAVPSIPNRNDGGVIGHNCVGLYWQPSLSWSIHYICGGEMTIDSQTANTPPPKKKQ